MRRAATALLAAVAAVTAAGLLAPAPAAAKKKPPCCACCFYMVHDPALEERRKVIDSVLVSILETDRQRAAILDGLAQAFGRREGGLARALAATRPAPEGGPSGMIGPGVETPEHVPNAALLRLLSDADPDLARLYDLAHRLLEGDTTPRQLLHEWRRRPSLAQMQRFIERALTTAQASLRNRRTVQAARLTARDQAAHEAVAIATLARRTRAEALARAMALRTMADAATTTREQVAALTVTAIALHEEATLRAAVDAATVQLVAARRLLQLPARRALPSQEIPQ